MPVSSAITSPPMCGITILAYCFWNIIRTRVASAYRKTLASCTAISLRILCNPAPRRANFSKAPVICLSVSSKDVYHRTGNEHPVLGIEYAQEGVSLTERYFSKMGLQVRYFMPKTASRRWPFILPAICSAITPASELIATISTMETFQKIYRPEIYNANSPAGQYYQPNLSHTGSFINKNRL